MNIIEAWHAFMLRKTLLTHWSVGFDFTGATSFRTPVVRDTAASLLYIELVSILVFAIRQKLPDNQTLKLKKRLKALHQAGELLDFDNLNAIYHRRTEIAHEIERGATVKELDGAVEAVRAQLRAWGMIKDLGEYVLEFTSKWAASSDDPKVAFGQDLTIQLKAAGEVYMEMKQTKQFHRISADPNPTDQAQD